MGARTEVVLYATTRRGLDNFQQRVMLVPSFQYIVFRLAQEWPLVNVMLVPSFQYVVFRLAQSVAAR